ncbi:MAG: hypothetical protein WCY37_03520 [Candidatus Dojkabacteria bacterium]
MNISLLLTVIMMVESGGDVNAVGDNGKALGPFQIHEAFWTDACDFGGVDWDYRTCAHDLEKSRQVVLWYWQRYVPEKEWSYERLARVHVGGPQGHLKECTLPYWNKIKDRLDE